MAGNLKVKKSHTKENIVLVSSKFIAEFMNFHDKQDFHTLNIVVASLAFTSRVVCFLPFNWGGWDNHFRKSHSRQSWKTFIFMSILCCHSSHDLVSNPSRISPQHIQQPLENDGFWCVSAVIMMMAWIHNFFLLYARFLSLFYYITVLVFIVLCEFMIYSARIVERKLKYHTWLLDSLTFMANVAGAE